MAEVKGIDALVADGLSDEAIMKILMDERGMSFINATRFLNIARGRRYDDVIALTREEAEAERKRWAAAERAERNRNPR